MLTTQSETSIIERMKVARGVSEPEVPTEEPAIVDVSEIDATDEIEEEVIDEVEETVTDEVEEFETQEDEMYLDLDGEEIPLSQIKEWKSGNMRQSDYTRKTTELAEQRKEFDAKQEDFNLKQSQLADTIAQLQSVIETEELSAEELKELRDYEPDEYIKYVEKQQKRKDALTSAKSKMSNSIDFDPKTEQAKLWSANPHWSDNGKPTKAYEQDLSLLNSYATKAGVTPEKFAKFDSTMIQIMLDAAKFADTNKKNAAITKQVRKAPITTKPKPMVKQGLQSEIEKAQARFKQSGKVEDAVALRKLKNKLNN